MDHKNGLLIKSSGLPHCDPSSTLTIKPRFPVDVMMALPQVVMKKQTTLGAYILDMLLDIFLRN